MTRIVERLAVAVADYTPIPADRWLAVIERTMAGAAPFAFTESEREALAEAASERSELLMRQGDVADAERLAGLAGRLLEGLGSADQR